MKELDEMITKVTSGSEFHLSNYVTLRQSIDNVGIAINLFGNEFYLFKKSDTQKKGETHLSTS